MEFMVSRKQGIIPWVMRFCGLDPDGLANGWSDSM
jgi:hypothetical protein